MKHLNDEIILSWINGDLLNDQVTEAKKHVDDCNTCLLRFSVLLKSQKDITGQSLEKAPSDAINKVKGLLGLEQDENRIEDSFEGVKKGPEEFQDIAIGALIRDSDVPSGPMPVSDKTTDQPFYPYGRRLFATLTKPGPALYSLASAVVVVLIMITIIRDGTEVDDDIEPSKVIERFTQPRIMDPASNEEIAGFQVNLENDILKITQPIMFKRGLKVYSEKGDLILDTEFTDTKNSFALAMGDATLIRVVISSLDKIVLEQSISLIQQE